MAQTSTDATSLARSCVGVCFFLFACLSNLCMLPLSRLCFRSLVCVCVCGTPTSALPRVTRRMPAEMKAPVVDKERRAGCHAVAGSVPAHRSVEGRNTQYVKAHT